MKPSDADQRRGFVTPHTVTPAEERAHLASGVQQIRRRGRDLTVWCPILTAVTLAVVASYASGATAPEIGAASVAGGIHALSVNGSAAGQETTRMEQLSALHTDNQIEEPSFVIAAEGTSLRYITYRLNQFRSQPGRT